MELSFKQVESVFAERFGIEGGQAAAFRSRLQHLQRAGVPSDVNTGKGTRAVYGWRQIVELVVALDFVDVGLRTEVSVAHVRSNIEKIIGSFHRILTSFDDVKSCAKAISKGRCTYKYTEIIVVSAGSLTIAQGQEMDGSYLLTLSAPEFKNHLARDPGFHPAEAHFDFGSRMLLVAGLVGKRVFPRPTETAQDLLEWSAAWAREELEP